MKKLSSPLALIVLLGSLPFVANAQSAEQALALEQQGNLAEATRLAEPVSCDRGAGSSPLSA
jgi:hypothetical protein